MSALENGTFTNDDSLLIPEATPIADAISSCGKIVKEEVDIAKQDRRDYLFDHNFLRYL